MIHYNPIPDSYYHPALWREQEPEPEHKCVNCEAMFHKGIQVQKEEKFCQACTDGNLHLIYYRDTLAVDAADIYRITTEHVESL